MQLIHDHTFQVAHHYLLSGLFRGSQDSCISSQQVQAITHVKALKQAFHTVIVYYEHEDFELEKLV